MSMVYTPSSLLCKDDDGVEKLVKKQSSEMCCIMIVADARDSKELYEDVFKEFYIFWGKLLTEGLPASLNGEPALLPFLLTLTADMKAPCILSSKGGGCKTKEFFTLCPCTQHISLIADKVGDDLCSQCKRWDKVKCLHHPFCDSITLPQLLHTMEEESGNYCNGHGHPYVKNPK